MFHSITTDPALLLIIACIFSVALALVIEIRRSRDLEQRLLRENFKNQVSLDLYRELRSAIATASSKATVVDTTIAMLPTRIAIYWKKRAEANFEPKSIRTQSQQLEQERTAANDSFVALASLLENYSTAFPAFGVFAKVLTTQIEMIETAHSLWSTEILELFPLQTPISLHGGGHAVQMDTRWRPSEEQQSHLETLTQRYLEVCGDMMGYLYDLGIEAEHLLLGNIFETKRPRRQPPEPTTMVLDSSPASLRQLELHLSSVRSNPFVFSEKPAQSNELSTGQEPPIVSVANG